jgi:hypothetical protein
MAIDPRISLGVQQLQLNDPLTQYGQTQNILAAQAQQRSAGTQNELAQAQLGQTRMTIQQAQEARDTVTKIMGEIGKHGGPADPMEAATRMLQDPRPEVQATGDHLLTSYQKVLAYQQDTAFTNRNAPKPPPVAAPSVAGPSAPIDEAMKMDYVKNGPPGVTYEDFVASRAEGLAAPVAAPTPVVTTPLQAPGVTPAPQVNNLPTTPPPAAAATTNALATPSKADQILEKINDLRTRFPYSVKAKEEIAFLTKQYEEANKAYTVAPGGALIVGGKEVYKAEEKDSDFEKLLAKTNLTEDEKKAMRLSKAKRDATHAPSAQQNVYAFTPASVEAQKQFVQTASDERKQLRNAPDALKNIQAAKKLIPSASTFMGTGGEPLLAAASFLNNRLGFGISTQGVTDATVLRTRLFEGILDNLKKLDSQPSQEQQRVLGEALGNLGTDPAALEQILDRIAETVEDRVGRFNTDVSEAEARGVKFPFKPQITLPPKALTPQSAVNQIPGQGPAPAASNSVKLPDGRFKTFPNAEAANQFKKDAGL